MDGLVLDFTAGLKDITRTADAGVDVGGPLTKRLPSQPVETYASLLVWALSWGSLRRAAASR